MVVFPSTGKLAFLFTAAGCREVTDSGKDKAHDVASEKQRDGQVDDLGWEPSQEVGTDAGLILLGVDLGHQPRINEDDEEQEWRAVAFDDFHNGQRNLRRGIEWRKYTSDTMAATVPAKAHHHLHAHALHASAPAISTAT